MGAAVCPTCGTTLRAGDVACTSCGTELAPEPSATGEARRIVTVLFSDVTGSTSMGEQLDPESLRRVMARYFAEMQVVLERHGATIEKYIGDAVMAVFGLPRAHEDDALRAVRAAVEMRAALDQLNVELEARWGVRIVTRTGLNTGEVLAGEASAQTSLVVGDAVNVAARLEQAAEPGDILLGEATLRLVRDAVVVEPAGPLTLKGKSEPVDAWRLVAVLPVVAGWSRRLDSPLVGRDSELARLADVFSLAVETSTSQMVTIIGGVGVGKSRLTTEFLRPLSAQAHVAVGRCLPYGEGITFRPVLDVVRDLLQLDDASAADEGALEDVLSAVEDGPMVGERLTALLRATDAALSVHEAFWAVRRLLQQLATTRPVVVVFDDIQWAEPTFLDLLEYLADWLGPAPVVVLCVARSELVEVRPGWLSGRANTTTLRLDRLPEDAVVDLIRNLLGGAEFAPDIGDRIAATAEGNPLFVEETLRMLVDDGLLRSVDGRWTVTDAVSAVTIPPTIHALIAARLDRLDPDERAVLERASVIGREFWWSAVAELTPQAARPAVGRHLQALSRKELVRPASSDLPGEDAFEFTHILVRDTAYAALPKELRAELHQRLATWMEQRGESWVDIHAEIIGYHFEQVHRTRVELGFAPEGARYAARRAAELLTAAGRRSFTRGDMPAAVNLLSRATSLLADDDPARLDALSRLAFALMELGDFERLMAIVGEMTEAAAASGDARAVAHATTLELYVRLFTSPASWAEQAEREAREAIATFDRVADEHGLAKAWSLLGLVNVWTGQFEPAQRAWEQAAAHAAAAGEWRDELEALSWVLLAMWAGPAPVEAGLERSRAVLERAGTNHKGRASAMFMRAVFEAAQGEHEVARGLIDQARGLLQEVALTVWTAGPLTQMAAFVELGAGDPAAAEAALRWGYEMLNDLGEMAWMPTLAALLAEAVYEQGRDAEAEELAERARELAGSEDVVSQILWRRVLACVRAKAGQGAAAEALIREAVDLANDTDSLPLQGAALVGSADVFVHLGRTEDARAVLDAAIARFERKRDVQASRLARQRLTQAATSQSGER